VKGAWFFLASGLATIAFALGACWWMRRGARAADFAWGAIAWTVAVLLKLLAALAAAAMLFLTFGEQVPPVVKFPVNGLLTGNTDCGLTLAVVALTTLRRAPWRSALAFGTAFGAFEAVVLAPALVLGGLAGLLPEALAPDHPAELARNLANPLRPFTFAWERVVVIPVHAISCVLVMTAFRRRSAAPFCAAFALKTAIDAVPGPDEGALPPLVVEAIYGAFGLVSLLALLRLGRSPAWTMTTSSAPPPPPLPHGDGSAAPASG